LIGSDQPDPKLLCGRNKLTVIGAAATAGCKPQHVFGMHRLLMGDDQRFRVELQGDGLIE